MTYLCCEECGFRAVRRPLSLASSCPRCRLRGRIVPFTENANAPSTASIALDSLRDDGLVAERRTATS
jgi:hypothetical protein